MTRGENIRRGDTSVKVFLRSTAKQLLVSDHPGETLHFDTEGCKVKLTLSIARTIVENRWDRQDL